MKFTLNWLKDHLETSASLEEISSALTSLGLEVEDVTDYAAQLAPFTVAKIISAEKHPEADRLQVCSVDTGKEQLQIVCGAPNARAGISVVLAPIGCTIPTNGMQIKKSKIRGVESNGMLCSGAELGLSEDSDGIMELDGAPEVGSAAAAALGFDDAMIDIAITPDRADCLGVRGIARDLAAKGLGTLKEAGSGQPEAAAKSSVSVTLDSKACPYYIGRSFAGVTNGESPAWLKNRLQMIGQKSISALVDITNYITFDLGRPLHVYDVAKLQGNLQVREAKAGEKLVGLNEREYDFVGGELVIADDAKPVAIAGVIGGAETGVSETTKDVFLEVAYFEPTEVRKLAKQVQTESDAKYRFERGVDPEFLEEGTAIATKMILDLCGGTASELVVAGASPHQPRTIAFNVAKTESLCGVKVEPNEAEEILRALEIKKTADGMFEVPSWRADVEGEADLVEEVIRVKGYEHIPTTAMPAVGVASVPATESNMRRVLVNRGMTEAVTFSFMHSKKAEIAPEVMLANPISSELDGMRPSILPNLIDAYERNAARGVRDVAVFEIGPVYEGVAPEQNRKMIAGVRTGQTAPKNHYKTNRPVDAFDAKADLFALLGLSVDPQKVQLEAGATTRYHPGRSATLKLGPKLLGYFGELHPALGLEDAAIGFELYLDQVPAAKNKRDRSDISDFQPVTRDFAFVVKEEVTAAALLKAVRQAEKKLIQDVSIFDVYQGKGLEEGSKSIALSVLLQANRTLETKEIDAVAAAIITNAEKQCGASLRG